MCAKTCLCSIDLASKQSWLSKMACFAVEHVGWRTSYCAVQAFLMVLISLAAKCAVGNIAH